MILLAVAAPAWANVGKRNGGAPYTGEPTGIDVRIASEELVIDLRPVVIKDAEASVRATYHLDNVGDAKHLDLMFASGTMSDHAFTVSLDGTAIPSVRVSDAKMPESWKPPTSTPDPGGGDLDYEVQGVSAMAFTLDVPPGKHDLVVSYQARLGWHHTDSPTLKHQFAYVLSPARTWAAFGGLDVTVHLPANWIAAVTPALTRDGDRLYGRFTTVPADTLAITIQASHRLYDLVHMIGLGLFALAGVGGIAWIIWRTRARRGTAWGSGAGWGGAIFGTGMLLMFVPDKMLPSGQADHYGYGFGFAIVAIILLSILAIPIGALIARIARPAEKTAA